MMTPEECGSCRYFRRNDIGQPMGVCRSRPPIPVMTGMLKHPISGEICPSIKTFWPELPDSEWCGGYMRRPVEVVDLKELAEMEGHA